MDSRAWTFSLCALLAGPGVLAQTAEQPGEAAPIERVGTRYRIVFHGADLEPELAGKLADQALAHAERMWPIVQKLVGARSREKHTIHIYRDWRRYHNVEGAANPLKAEVAGFRAKDGDGHVSLVPPLRQELLGHVGLPQLTAEHVVRVAADQVIAPLVPAEDIQGWMRWLLVMGAVESWSNPKRGYGVDAEYDLRRMPVVQVRREHGAISLQDLLAPPLQLLDLTEWRKSMSSAALLAEALQATSSRWGRELIAGKFGVLEEGSDLLDWRQAAVTSVFGRDLSKAELLLGKFAAATDLQWSMRQPVYQRDGERWLLAGTEEGAILDSVEPLPDGEYFIAGRIELGPGAPTPAWFTFGWDGGTLLGVFFDQGRVRIRRWERDSREWGDLLTSEASIERAVPFAFRIEVDRDRLVVSVDGKVAGSWPHEDRFLRGHVSFRVDDRIVWIEGLEFGRRGNGRRK